MENQNSQVKQSQTELISWSGKAIHAPHWVRLNEKEELVCIKIKHYKCVHDNELSALYCLIVAHT